MITNTIPSSLEAPKVSVIIVNYRTPKLLLEAIRSVMNTVRNRFEIIAVDNASGDNTATLVREQFPLVHMIQSSVNVGFAAGNNLAMPFARGEYIFFLNPDTIVHEGSIDTLIAYLDSHLKVGLVSPKLLNADGSLQRSINRFYSFFGTLFDNRIASQFLKTDAFEDHDTIREIDWAKGAALMIRHSILKEIGSFDEQFWIYAEEIDLCYRIKKAGWANVYLPSAVITHLEKQSSKQHRAEMFIQNYKSFYLFLRKHYSTLDFTLYRLRSIIGIFFWLTIYWIQSLRGNDSARKSLDTYRTLFQWHLNLSQNLSQKTLAPR
ncbi:MAG: glycosyltransferase family 2 protein [Chloroherpetonaceae bacterium]|nr:glycosyltransferase family 2 protein [Chloroherpetonaceae bacterium]